MLIRESLPDGAKYFQIGKYEALLFVACYIERDLSIEGHYLLGFDLQMIQEASTALHFNNEKKFEAKVNLCEKLVDEICLIPSPMR